MKKPMKKLYAYVMKVDNGFAPYPTKDLCTLACCKPKIRQAIGDSVVEEFRNKFFENLGYNKKLQDDGVIPQKCASTSDRLLSGAVEDAEDDLLKGIYATLKEMFDDHKGDWSWNEFKERCGTDCEARRTFTSVLLEAGGFNDGLIDTASMRRYFEAHPSFETTFDRFVTDMDYYVIGLVGKGMEGKGKIAEYSIVYCMKVTDVMDFAEYWERKPSRRPSHKYFIEHDRNDGKYDPDNCGDNVYELCADKDNPSVMTTIKATPSFHYFKGQDPVPQMLHDLGGTYVLASNQFVYYGNKAKVSVPLHKGRGQRKFEIESAHDLESYRGLHLNEAQITKVENALNETKQGCTIKGAPIRSGGEGEEWWSREDREES